MDGSLYDKGQASIKYISNVLKKSAGGYDYANNQLPWTIAVNQTNKMAMDQIILKDTLPAGTSLLEDSSIRFTKHTGTQDTPFTITKNNVDGLYYEYDLATRVVTFHIPDFQKQ